MNSDIRKKIFEESLEVFFSDEDVFNRTSHAVDHAVSEIELKIDSKQKGCRIPINYIASINHLRRAVLHRMDEAALDKSLELRYYESNDSSKNIRTPNRSQLDYFDKLHRTQTKSMSIVAPRNSPPPLELSSISPRQPVSYHSLLTKAQVNLHDVKVEHQRLRKVKEDKFQQLIRRKKIRDSIPQSNQETHKLRNYQKIMEKYQNPLKTFNRDMGS